MGKPTHIDDEGRARMVDVGDKAISTRLARAEGWIRLSEDAFQAVVDDKVAKGSVLAVAQLAGITAAKRTPDLIPLCHPLPLTGVEVKITPEAPDRIHVEACVSTDWKTGVEMEALTAVSAALLTIYDMVKSMDKAPVLGPIQLLEKKGGRSGHWQRA
jgi:cyclic pyranopterin phosphate synthase